MSEVHNDIVQLEKQLENAKIAVDQRNMVDRLTQYPEFRKLIIEGYMRDECARLTHMSSDPNLSAQDRADALASAQSAGHFKRWLNALILMGNRAEQDIIQGKEALDDLRAQDV